MRIIYSTKSNLEILIQACAKRTFTRAEIEHVYNHADLELLFTYFQDPADAVLNALKNLDKPICFGYNYNEFTNDFPLMTYSKDHKWFVSETKFKVSKSDVPKKKDMTKVIYRTEDAGFFWAKHTTVEIPKPIEAIEVDVVPGDKIQLGECGYIQKEFEVKSNSILKIAGIIYGSECNDDVSVQDYCVEHEAIHGEHERTYTDIGGKWLYVNDKKICHLSNGFGDGDYTLRFSEGKLVR